MHANPLPARRWVAMASYEARVTLSLTTLLPVLGLPIFALLRGVLSVLDHDAVAAYELRRAFELILPLVAGLAAAHLMTVEHEAGFAELRASYPEPAWHLPLLRTASALLLTLLAAGLGCAAFRLAFGPYSVGAALFAAVPPTLYMLGLSLLTGHLTRNAWIAYGLVMALWFFEIQTRGEVTRALFLFQDTWPLAEVSRTLNRRLLVGLGVLLLALNVGLSYTNAGSRLKIRLWRRGRRRRS